MATEKHDTRVKTGIVRFSYPHLFEPSSVKGSEPKYGIQIIIDKNDEATYKALTTAYSNATENGKREYGAKFKPSPFFRPVGGQYGLLIDCDEDPEKKDQEEYKGKYLMTLKSTKAPDVLAVETGRRKLDQEEGEKVVYAGCYGKVTLSVYPYSNDFGTGVSASINNVLKVRDGEPFSGRVSGEDDFADELSAMSDEELESLI